MAKLRRIRSYIRVQNGKYKRVRSHKRLYRKLGKKIHMKKVGYFYVKLDNFGNVRGSKVIKIKNKS